MEMQGRENMLAEDKTLKAKTVSENLFLQNH